MNNDEFLSRIVDAQKDKNSWWLLWNRITYENQKIDFTNFNDTYYSLFDTEMFNKIIDSVVEQIIILLNRLKNEKINVPK